MFWIVLHVEWKIVIDVSVVHAISSIMVYDGQSARSNIPEDFILQQHRREQFKYCSVNYNQPSLVQDSVAGLYEHSKASTFRVRETFFVQLNDYEILKKNK